jgi:hypothetical protein
MTLVEMLDIALVIRSVSPRAVKKAGNDEINILSILSGLACGVGEPSASADGLAEIPESWDNPIGLLVKMAAKRRSSRSYNPSVHESTMTRSKVYTYTKFFPHTAVIPKTGIFHLRAKYTGEFNEPR